MVPTTASNTFLRRFIGAAALDQSIHEEVEADPDGTLQAFVVVVLSSAGGGIGARGFGGTSVASFAFFSVVGLLAWALLTFEIGGRLMPGPETRVAVGQLLRTIGFASTPGLLRVLGIMPAVTVPVFVVTSVWMLLAMIVAPYGRRSTSVARLGRWRSACWDGRWRSPSRWSLAWCSARRFPDARLDMISGA